MVVSLLFIIFTLIIIVNTIVTEYYTLPSRSTWLISAARSVGSIFREAGAIGSICGSILLLLLSINLLGNVPGVLVPSSYYFYTCTLSLRFWVSLMFVIFITQIKNFVAHILPYGSPAALGLFLPLVEIFSQIIRPFTLIVRLRTNLSSGHIMLYMFSFFSLSSLTLILLTSLVVGMLFVLELFISALQAYIFTSLMFLYVSEGLTH